uniref:Uncharacterized protein n=1 Tax=Cucumis melo TaxID=3656 RepID=A0A9I9ED93_CUCME
MREARLQLGTLRDSFELDFGNGWDPLLGTINLEEEQWNELFKTNKRAKKFRKSGCTHYEKLVTVFGDTTTIGVNACTSQDISNSEDENENDVASNIKFGVEENDKGKRKKMFEERKPNLAYSS